MNENFDTADFLSFDSAVNSLYFSECSREQASHVFQSLVGESNVKSFRILLAMLSNHNENTANEIIDAIVSMRVDININSSFSSGEPLERGNILHAACAYGSPGFISHLLSLNIDYEDCCTWMDGASRTRFALSPLELATRIDEDLKNRDSERSGKVVKFLKAWNASQACSFNTESICLSKRFFKEL